MKTQTRARFDQELRAVQDNILRLGQMVDAAIDQSIRCLADRDQPLAHEIIENDTKINELRYKVEVECLTVTALHQPLAGDLRSLVAALIIVSELERMADHAAGIARIVLRMGDEPLLKPLIDMPRMAQTCRQMLNKALQAYKESNIELARQVAAQDDEIDALYTQIFRELLSFMIEDPGTISRALYLLFAAHNYERIGDRVTNIAERVVFMASGEIKELNPEHHESSIN
jgi:phosphate transport system protein